MTRKIKKIAGPLIWLYCDVRVKPLNEHVLTVYMSDYFAVSKKNFWVGVVYISC